MPYQDKLNQYMHLNIVTLLVTIIRIGKSAAIISHACAFNLLLVNLLEEKGTRSPNTTAIQKP